MVSCNKFNFCNTILAWLAVAVHQLLIAGWEANLPVFRVWSGCTRCGRKHSHSTVICPCLRLSYSSRLWIGATGTGEDSRRCFFRHCGWASLPVSWPQRGWSRLCVRLIQRDPSSAFEGKCWRCGPSLSSLTSLSETLLPAHTFRRATRGVIP